MQGFTNAAPPSGGGLRIVASGTSVPLTDVILPEPASFILFSVYDTNPEAAQDSHRIIFTYLAYAGQRADYGGPEANAIPFLGLHFSSDGIHADFYNSSGNQDARVTYIALA